MNSVFGKGLAKALIPAIAALMLAGCADDSNNVGGGGGGTTSGSTSGSTGGTTSGVTSGSTGGTTSGVTSGSTGGTTSGVTSGSTGGTTSGTTSGATGGTTSGVTGGTTSGATGGTTSGSTTGGPTPCSLDGSCPPPPTSLSDCSTTSTTYRPLTVTSQNNGVTGICVGCNVANQTFAFDGNTTTAATMTATVGALDASVFLAGQGATTFPINRRVGVFVSDPAGQLLTATLLQNLTFTTTLTTATGTRDVESVNQSSVLNADLLGNVLINGTPTANVNFINVVSTSPFNGVRVNFTPTVGALADINVIEACVSQPITAGGTSGGTTGGTSTGGTSGGVTPAALPTLTQLSDCSTAPEATFSPIVTSNVTNGVAGLCLGCTVDTPASAFDGNTATAASINTTVGALGSVFVAGQGAATYTPVPSKLVRVGFLVSDPNGQLLTATLLQGLTVTTTLTANSTTTVAEARSQSSVLNADLLGNNVINGLTTPDLQYVYFDATAPFNGVRLDFSPLIGALANLNVIEACVSK